MGTACSDISTVPSSGCIHSYTPHAYFKVDSATLEVFDPQMNYLGFIDANQLKEKRAVLIQEIDPERRAIRSWLNFTNNEHQNQPLEITEELMRDKKLIEILDRSSCLIVDPRTMQESHMPDFELAAEQIIEYIQQR